MNIAITPRVGQYARRDEERLKAENNLLLTLSNVTGASVPATRERDALSAAKLIECYPAPGKQGRKLFKLTAAGVERAEALRRRAG